MSTRKKNSKRGGKQASSSAKKPLLLTIPAHPAPPIEAPGSQDTVQPGTPAALVEHPLDDAPSLVPSPSSAPLPSAVSEIPEEVQVAEEPASEPEKLPEKEAMTRVKSAKTTALDKVFQDISSSSDSEKGDSLPPVTKRGPGCKKPAAPAEDQHDETSQWLILLIPHVSGAGDKRKILPLSASYMDALSEIYTIIGCTQVRRKPELTYRLSTRPGKSTPIDLGCEEDWQGLCDEVAEGQRRKKATIQVVIIVSDSMTTTMTMLAEVMSFL
ncbi:hypothetical protein NLJ89_g11927 [Agrocybe chaxingu]|uniref:Uncharacterized protein n=1 Tax=Agrocybe chaxingu TaxID=84603 RepID=A0A9W8JMU4_9AGAR|nr:hypothetical protein NLJ89_g11927 [Agrocybe chaxingu]